MILLYSLVRMCNDITRPSTKNLFSILFAKFIRPWVKSNLSLSVKFLIYVLIVSYDANMPSFAFYSSVF